MFGIETSGADVVLAAPEGDITLGFNGAEWQPASAKNNAKKLPISRHFAIC